VAEGLVCRPGSVPGRLAALRSAAIHLGPPLPVTSCGPPAHSGGQPSDVRCSTLLRAGFAEPARSPGSLVVSCTTVSPLPRSGDRGGLFSVALSRGSLRVGVAHRPALGSPDLPRHLPMPRPPDQPLRGSECRAARAGAPSGEPPTLSGLGSVAGSPSSLGQPMLRCVTHICPGSERGWLTAQPWPAPAVTHPHSPAPEVWLVHRPRRERRFQLRLSEVWSTILPPPRNDGTTERRNDGKTERRKD